MAVALKRVMKSCIGVVSVEERCCEECALADGTIMRLGVCSDCEEVYEAEEDYRGWK